jgi:hypothetical protein
MALPMEQLGKESAHFQITKFGPSYEEYRSLKYVTDGLLQHHPGKESNDKFLCLMRLRRDTPVSRFESFSKRFFCKGYEAGEDFQECTFARKRIY